jgi:hypothetical protein
MAIVDINNLSTEYSSILAPIGVGNVTVAACFLLVLHAFCCYSCT